jgi:hypothetical protein
MLGCPIIEPKLMPSEAFGIATGGAIHHQHHQQHDKIDM